MAYDLPVNEWLLVPENWRPNSIVPTLCEPFLFHHIRVVGWNVVTLSESSGSLRNQTQIIYPRQVSLITNVSPGYFHCVTITSNLINREERMLFAEYLTYEKLGQAKTWHIDFKNFFQGPFEAFNGPNPIDISGK